MMNISGIYRMVSREELAGEALAFELLGSVQEKKE
jgi:hypothetical protein